MFGMLLVLMSVVGGYSLEGGDPAALVRPEELLMIGGAGAGMAIAFNRPEHLAALLRALRASFRRSEPTKRSYLATLITLLSVFEFARRAGPSRVEADLDAPDGGAVLERCKASLAVAGTPEFVCDSIRMAALGRVAPRDLEDMLECDLDVGRQARERPAESARSLADALPGFGIAAAVLGVVITMGSMDRPPAEIGAKVGAAMMGTFLGILLSYGFASPVAERMAGVADRESQYFEVIRAGVAGFARGMPSAIAVEFARREIPPDLRPSFQSVEEAWRAELATAAAIRAGPMKKV